MAIKGTRATQIANDTNVTPVTFNFKTYDGTYQTFYNNAEQIDFVTGNGNLYVTVVDGTEYVAGDPAEHGFLLVVAKGEDGEMGATGEQGPAGHAPRITAKFEGNQVTIYADGVRIAATNDLTPPSWKPELVNHTIVWSKTKDDTTPSPIDLDLLRPTDANPVIFRVDSDNTKRDDEESGPAKFIQWKYEGEEYGRNLISIDELMNVALAGISFWVDAEDSNAGHFGHREVVSATYDVQEEGGKSIAHVELGDVLFDAGRIPFANYELEFGELENRIVALEQALADPNIDLTPYYDVFATRDWSSLTFTSKEEFTAGKERVNQDYAKKTDLPSTNTFLTRDAAQSLYQPIGNYATMNDIPNTDTLLSKTEADNLYAKKTDLTNPGYIEDISFEFNGNALYYCIQKNGQGGSLLPTNLSIDLDNCVKNITFDRDTKELIGTSKDNTSHSVSLASLVGTNGVTEDGVRQYVTNALQNIPSGGGNGTVTSVDGVSPDSNGNVALGAVRSITFNGQTLQNVNGAVTISVGTYAFDVQITSNGMLQKRENGGQGVDVGSVGGGGTGTGSDGTEQAIRNLITGYSYATEAGVQEYTYSKSQIDNMIGTGPTGTNEILHTFTLYQRNNIEDDGIHRPTVPSNSDFTGDGRSMILTDTHASTNPSPWLNSPENQDTANGKVYLWVTMANYSSRTGIDTTQGWSNPVCLTGRNGADGVDGDYREFIYYRNDGSVVPQISKKGARNPEYSYSGTSIIRNFDKATLENSQYNGLFEGKDALPLATTAYDSYNSLSSSLNFSVGTDNPNGVTDTLICEWVSIRTISYDANNNPIYEHFSDPVIWSMGGEDGMDGDGVEYIYYITPENNSQTTYYRTDSETGKYILEKGVGNNVGPPTTSQEIANISNYQDDDGYPGNTQQGTTGDRNGTDNPLGISADRPYEGVAIRKKINGLGQPFSEPSLGAKFGKDGASTSIYTSYIFTRTDTDISSFILSDDISPQDVKTYTSLANKQNNIEYTYGNNQHLVWHDSVPSNSTETVGMSMNIINDTSGDQGGTSPVILSDSDTFQVEYCASESIAKALPQLNNSVYIDPTQVHGINETTLRAYMRNTYNEVGGDENDITDPVGMATASKVNGVGTNGTYARIKGEKGEAGTSVKIVNTVEYAVDLSAFAPNLGTVNAASVGDCFIVLSGTGDGLSPANVPGHITATNYTRSHLGTCTGTVGNSSDFTNVDMYGFHDLGEFGSVDPNSVFVKFAKDATSTEIQNAPNATTAQMPVFIDNQYVNTYITMLNTDVAGPYIGVYTGQTASTDVRDYTGTKGNGEDGYGMEQIFIKMPEGETPVRPTKALIPTTQNPLTNATRISGFKTLQAGTGSTSGNAVTEVNYMKPDYLPVVTVYTNGVSSTQEGFDTPQEIYDNSTIKYDCGQCTRNKNTDPTLQGSAPTRYYKHVENGKDGKDGKFEESVYILTEDDTPPTLLENVGCVYNGIHTSGKKSYIKRTGSTANQVLDFLPSNSSNPTTTTPVGQSGPNNTFPIEGGPGGKDNPQGVDEDYPYEWIATRKITYEDSNNPHTPTFGSFSEPSIGSHFGDNGRDGDGLEYVFGGVTVAQSEIIDTMIQNASNHEIFPDQNSSFTGTVGNKHYQDSDFLPTLTITGNTVLQSVDNNPGITSAHPCIYASKRKFHDSGNGGSGGNFGPVTLWNVQGPQGPQGPAGTNGANGNVYTVVPTFTSLVASNPTTNNGTTTYSITGSAGGNLYENGVAQSNAYCEAYLGSTQLTISHSNGSNDFSVTIPNNTTSSILFVQVLWYNSSSKTNFYDGTVIPVSIKGADGQNGAAQSLEGPVMRLRQWTNSTAYYNGTTAASDGIKYLDVIWVNEGTSQDPEINYYKCVNNHTSAASGSFAAGINWELYTMMSDSVFNTILARSAYITNLTSHQVVITDGNNTVQGGMTSGKAISNVPLDSSSSTFSATSSQVGSIRIGAGPLDNSGNLSSAPFTVDNQGNVKASGNITANKIVVSGNNIQFAIGVLGSTPTTTPDTIYFLY